MLKSFFTAKRCARAGVIAALYALLTVALQSFSFGNFQFRVSEALTVLPAIFPEAIPALFIGCLIANILGNGIYDIFIGSFATLVAALLTYFVSKAIKNIHLKLFVSAIFPGFVQRDRRTDYLYSVRNRDPHIYNRGVDHRRGRGGRRIYVRHGALLFDSQNNVRF